MSKTNPKKFAQLCRKYTILADLMIDTIDEIEQFGYNEGEFKENIKKVLNKCCEITEQAYTVEKVRNTTYLGNLSNQIDTLIRKKFNIE